MATQLEARLRAFSIRFALGALATASAVHAQTTQVMHTLYVDATAAPGGNGSDWLHAFRDVQDALALVPTNPGGTTPDRYSIRIAQGIYRPDRATLNRDASFVVNSAATLSGGFGGLRSPNPDLQDDQFVTVLSGDLRNDDGPNLTHMEDNSRHVVTINGSASITTYGTPYFPAQLSNLTISGGNAENEGGAGVRVRPTEYVNIQSCTIKNNRGSFGAALDLHEAVKGAISGATISDNFAALGGGGVNLGDTRCQIYQSSFLRNTSAASAGALEGYYIDVSNCLFADNTGMTGGAIAAQRQASIHACRLVGNAASYRGGALYVEGNARCVIDVCLFGHNTAPAGAGLSIASGGRADIINCTLVRNVATSGGGLWIDPSAPGVRVWNSIFWNNSATRGASIDGIAAVDHSILQGGASGAPAATLGPVTLTSNPLFSNPTGTSTAPRSWADKDYHILPGSPAIDAGREPPVEVRESPYSHSLDPGERVINNTCAAYSRIDIGAYESTVYSCPDLIPVLYVRASSPLGGNGRTWATAYRDIQDALDTPGVTAIWIAEGTYTADRGTFDPESLYRIEKPFVSLHGGFAGTETTLAQRNIAAHPTILSADLLRNDSNLPTSTLDNSSRILSFSLPNSQTPTTAEVSGLTFRGAQFSGLLAQAKPAVSFFGNGFQTSTFTLSDCAFINNHVMASVPSDLRYLSGYRVSPVVVYGDLNLLRCRFVGNSSSLSGGALSYTGSLDASDCEFVGNSAAVSGGALAGNEYNGASFLRRCTFLANAVIGPGSVAGGAASMQRLSLASACRFVGNVTLSTGPRGDIAPSASGGALFLNYQTATIFNSILTGNRCVAPAATGAAVEGDGLNLFNCTIADNAAGPTLSSGSQSSAIRTYGGTIQNCIFWNSPAFGADESSGPSLGNFYGSFKNSIVQGTPPGSAINTRFINPLFKNPAGPDGIIGTSDDDYSLRPNSPAIDAADANLPAVYSSLDAAGHARFFDAPLIPNTGLGTPNYMDIGALEFDGRACAADFNASGSLSAQDIFDFLAAWFASAPSADFNASGSLTAQDIFDFLGAWFAGC